MSDVEILKREQGIIILNQYGKSYIRFMAGGISDKLYQIEISKEELDLVMNSSINGELIVNRYMNLEPGLPEGLEDRVIIDYLSFSTDYSDRRKQAILNKFHKYGDIFNEFYYYVLREIFEDGVVESGYYASKLVKEFNLSPLDAYNYLIYLREDTQNAIAGLKDGLQKSRLCKVARTRAGIVLQRKEKDTGNLEGTSGYW